MGRRNSKPRTPATGLQKLVSESPFVWDQYRLGHTWDCTTCGEKIFNSNNSGRVGLSQFSMENNTRGISHKAQLHLANGCAADDKKLPERKDLDN